MCGHNRSMVQSATVFVVALLTIGTAYSAQPVFANPVESRLEIEPRTEVKPRTKIEPKCPYNEVYARCGGCEATCEVPNPTCWQECGPPECQCPRSLLRTSDGACVMHAYCD